MQSALCIWKHSLALILTSSKMNTQRVTIDRLHGRRARNFADVRAGIDVEPKCLEAREDLMNSLAETRQREKKTFSKTIPSAGFKPPDEENKT
jgi:RAB protein geranylgeranyltransferase component A